MAEFEFAIRIRYGRYNRPRNTWRRKTTKWYDDPDQAWEEAESYQFDPAYDVASSIIKRIKK